MAVLISDVAEDLLTKIKGISNFGNRVGLAVGGQEIDPQLRQLPHPAAWVVYVGDTVETPYEATPCPSVVTRNFVVKILIDYDLNESQLTSDFDLLQITIQTIAGSSGPNGTQPWFYAGQVLDELNPDRQVWDQNYSIRMIS